MWAPHQGLLEFALSAGQKIRWRGGLRKSAECFFFLSFTAETMNKVCRKALTAMKLLQWFIKVADIILQMMNGCVFGERSFLVHSARGHFLYCTLKNKHLSSGNSKARTSLMNFSFREMFKPDFPKFWFKI